MAPRFRYQPPRVEWPEGKSFAFTIFDDPDGQSLEQSRLIYGFLRDLGFRTTKAVWPIGPLREANSPGATCQDPAYLAHVLDLQSSGFEVGFHNAAPHSATREEIMQALEDFKRWFGEYPAAMANHYNADALYWGPDRLTGARRLLYNALTRRQFAGRYFGAQPGSPYFWGDLCREKIRYCRNLVFREINTLRACPWLPYHDARRPYVPAWYAGAEGANYESFCRLLGEANQDRLEEERGAAIVYTHFGHYFDEGGALKRRFEELMRRLAKRNGWFVPVSTLLDTLAERNGLTELTNSQRAWLEWRWLRAKLLHGTS